MCRWRDSKMYSWYSVHCNSWSDLSEMTESQSLQTESWQVSTATGLRLLFHAPNHHKLVHCPTGKNANHQGCHNLTNKAVTCAACLNLCTWRGATCSQGSKMVIRFHEPLGSFLPFFLSFFSPSPPLLSSSSSVGPFTSYQALHQQQLRDTRVYMEVFALNLSESVSLCWQKKLAPWVRKPANGSHDFLRPSVTSNGTTLNLGHICSRVTTSVNEADNVSSSLSWQGNRKGRIHLRNVNNSLYRA